MRLYFGTMQHFARNLTHHQVKRLLIFTTKIIVYDFIPMLPKDLRFRDFGY